MASLRDQLIEQRERKGWGPGTVIRTGTTVYGSQLRSNVDARKIEFELRLGKPPASARFEIDSAYENCHEGGWILGLTWDDGDEWAEDYVRKMEAMT